MKRQILYLIFIYFSTTFTLFGNQIVKIVQTYVLVDSDQSLGEVSDTLIVKRIYKDEFINIGKIQIVEFKNNQIAAKIIEEYNDYKIDIGDFVFIIDRVIYATINTSVNAIKNPYPGSSFVMRMKVGTKVVATAFNDDYIKIKHDNKVCYVHKEYLNIDNAYINKLQSEFLILENEKQRRKNNIKEKLSLMKKNPAWIKIFAGNVRDGPSINNKEIDQLEQGIPIYIQERVGGWYKVRYNKDDLDDFIIVLDKKDIDEVYKEGWVFENLISFEEVRKLSYLERQVVIRRKHFVENNPNINSQFKQDILNGTIRLGMTKEMVTASWGKPSDINRSVGVWGVHEQWIYGDTYVYFEDGILTSWQD